MNIPSEDFVEVGSYKISVKIRKNSDKWIILLHGWGCAKEEFDEAFGLKGLEQFSLCSIDLLGFGDSDRPRGFSYDFADHAKVVSEIVQKLGAEKIYLVGHSMGGGVGLLCAQGLGNKLKLFINVEGNLVPTDSRIMRQLAGYSYPMFKLVFFPLTILALRSSKRLANRRWSKWLGQTDTWAGYQSARSATEWSDSGKLLPMFVALPKKVYVYGENSVRAPFILPKLKNVEIRKITRSGHFPMIDNPKDFYTTLERLIIER